MDLFREGYLYGSTWGTHYLRILLDFGAYGTGNDLDAVGCILWGRAMDGFDDYLPTLVPRCLIHPYPGRSRIGKRPDRLL